MLSTQITNPLIKSQALSSLQGGGWLTINGHKGTSSDCSIPMVLPNPHHKSNPRQYLKSFTNQNNQKYTNPEQTTQADLQQWTHIVRTMLQQSPNFQPHTTTNTSDNPLQMTIPLTTIQLVPLSQQTIQTPIAGNPHNQHWGDACGTITPSIIQIMSRNVNSLSTHDNYLQWRAAAQVIKELQATAICFQETNIQWTQSTRSTV